MEVKVGMWQETRRPGLRSSYATDKPRRVMRAGTRGLRACTGAAREAPCSCLPLVLSTSFVPGTWWGCFTGQFKLVPSLCLLGQLCLQGGGKLSWCNETLLDGMKKSWFRVINYLWAAPSSQLLSRSLKVQCGPQNVFIALPGTH